MPTRKSNSRTTREQPPTKSGSPLPLNVLSSKTVFKGRVFDVTRDRVQEPNGVTAIREVIRHSGSVVVLAVDDSAPELPLCGAGVHA